MKRKSYDTLIVGPCSIDIMIDCNMQQTTLVGGAVIQSGYAAANTGSRTAVFTKLNTEDADIYKAFEHCNADVYWKPSKATTSIRNQYFTQDQEKRECQLLSKCDKIKSEEIPYIESSIYHFAGLTVGDFDEDIFKELKDRGKIAVDAQCLLRKAEPNGELRFYDWEQKEKYLPYIDFFKTDAAEAEILTGKKEREEAAKQLYAWGAKEVMITHNTEVLIYDGNDIHKCPIKARSLVGRTGRGDTCFAGYITRRLKQNIKDSLLFATALVSLKMETPGPYCGDEEDVQKYINKFYC